MYFRFYLIFVCCIIFLFSTLWGEPGFNGSAPGCSGGSCHSHNTNDVTAVAIGNMQIQITLSGVSSGKRVGGELVDSNGNVIASINSTSSNPFILTAPANGKYLVNAGYKNPSRRWDSTSVDLTLSGINESSEKNILSDYKLFQNYPNPFNPTTTIRFSIPKTEYVSLKIYTLTGQEIATLVSDNLNKGDYIYSWNAGSVASGVYLYELRTSTSVKTKKMILLR